MGANIARLPPDARPGVIESLAPQVGRLVVSETFTKSTAVAIIERDTPISSETKIVPPEGMREVPLGPGMTKSGSLSYMRYFTSLPDGPPCNAMLYGIDDPSTYELEMDHPHLTDAIREGRAAGYSLSVECT
jgi:hypothetical protein